MGVIVILLIIIIAIFIFNINSLPIKLDAKDVVSIEIVDLPNMETQLLLTSGIDDLFIKEIVRLFNKSEKIRDDVGTTHPIWVKVTMKDYETVNFWWGVGGFITVGNENIQFNMKNEELNNYIIDNIRKGTGK
jgi:hypothetical protein